MIAWDVTPPLNTRTVGEEKDSYLIVYECEKLLLIENRFRDNSYLAYLLQPFCHRDFFFFVRL